MGEKRKFLKPKLVLIVMKYSKNPYIAKGSEIKLKKRIYSFRYND